MAERSTLFKELLLGRHWQKFETFRAEFLKAAAQIAPELTKAAPSKAQYYRWLTGQLTTGRPYPDACRVLEAMFPGRTAEELFRPADRSVIQNDHPRRSNPILLDTSLLVDADSAVKDHGEAGSGRGSLLASTPPSFPVESLAGFWVTSYQFGPVEDLKFHADIAELSAASERRLRAKNYPPEPRTDGHKVPFRNEIEVELAGRHLVGTWKNTSDARYFGSIHLAVLTYENVLDGYYTNLSGDTKVGAAQWRWVRIDDASIKGADVDQVTLAAPNLIHEIVAQHSMYDAPLKIASIVEEGT